MKALIISAEDFEDLELLVPYYRLKEENIETDIASIKKGSITGKHKYEVIANKELKEINPKDYAFLILPGGKAPQKIRHEEKAQKIAQAFNNDNKLIAAICHGPQILISANLMKGKHATSYKEIAKELKDAEALYEDKEVVVDGNLITSRKPEDLPAFMREIMKRIKINK
ncbi:MAG: type 1 glutamine amidotransferase [Oligoflexia bacterium]|nr:type 1 glutamine amidotransferase [Oligoflexia bacterium]